MPTSEPSSPLKFDPADDEVASYRAVSSLAVAGLLAGLLSPLAMFTGLLWPMPLAAVAISGLALRRIALRWPELAGRPAAVIGLILGVAFCFAAPVDDFVYHYCLRQQARQFADIWIDAVRQGEIYKAHHLMVNADRRIPLESELVNFYRKNLSSRRLLKQFADQPAIRTLFALGQAADIRFYETASEGHEDFSDVVRQTYAVTYADEHEQPKTFFITLDLRRAVDTGNRLANWTLKHVEGGVRPKGW
jgi:hypothetical protein